MNTSQINAADSRAAQAQVAVEPVWASLAPAREAIGLADRVVLHAGPPCALATLCTPIRNSAAMAALYEGWAKTEAEAHALVASGELTFRPAQDSGAVVPLASVLTASMAVHVVADARNEANRSYAPINGGGGPALRLGTAGPQVAAHLRWLNSELADYLRLAVAAPIPLIEIADAALAEGDDCHGRTVEATRLLVERMAQTVGTPPAAVRNFFEGGPSFFLNIWMAACRTILAAAAPTPGSSLVVAIGGNGYETGLKVAGIPDRWFTAPADPPSGQLENGYAPEDRLGAIGDSAVVDAAGFGAMAMHEAPAQQAALGPYMPEASDTLGERLYICAHRAFARARIRTALAARNVVEAGRSGAISLGILDRNGVHGRIGGGVYAPPPELFARAAAALESEGV